MPRALGTYSSRLFRWIADDACLIAFVDEQLNPSVDGNGNVTDPDVDVRLANPAYETLNKNFDELWNDYEVNGSPPGGPYVKLPVQRDATALTLVGQALGKSLMVGSEFRHMTTSMCRLTTARGMLDVEQLGSRCHPSELLNFRMMLQRV